MRRFSICFVAICFIGCVDAQRSPVPSEGLTFAPAERGTGISGTWSEGDLVVHFQTLPDAEGEGVSARWSDADGYSIAIDFSGDPRAYEQWGDETPPAEVRHKRAALLPLVMRGAEALATLETDERSTRHVVFLRSLADVIPPLDERAMVATPEEIAEATASPEGTLAYNTGTYKQLFRVIDSGIVGAHQCTAWSNYYLDSNGYWYYYNYLLNRNGHGDTPACDVQTCASWSAPHGYKGSGKCGTPYQLCGFYSYRHNCRSDAKWQQNWVMRNSYCSTTGGICYHPQGLFNGASCSASTSCSSGFNACL